MPWPTNTSSPDVWIRGSWTPLNATTSSRYRSGAPPGALSVNDGSTIDSTMATFWK